jgi:DNA-binding transcriptional ArsR family regulator
MDGSLLSVGQVVDATGRSQTTVSKHLKRMTAAGVLVRSKEGLQVFYQLKDPVWEKLCRLVSNALRDGAGT